MSTNKTKVTYDYERRNVLLLKVAFKKGDFKSFQTILSELPKTYSVTIVTDEHGSEELFVNIPAKAKESGGIFG